MGRQPLTIEQRVTEVCRLASLAKRHYDVWRVYTAPESRTRLWEAFDEYADFMLLDERAHQELSILYAASLFETKGNTLHIPSLIDELRIRGTAPVLVEEAERALEALQGVIGKARFLRHNAIAHRTASMSRDEVFKRAKITNPELGELVARADELASSLAKAVGHSPVVLTFFAASALDRLFTDAGRWLGLEPEESA
jgi:hypothetical protein